MIKFEDCIDSTNILKKTNQYFENEEYLYLVKYVARFYNQCSNEIKSQLLQNVARVYEKWGCVDKSITLLKFACTLDENSVEAHYLLAKILLAKKDTYAFQQAFFKMGAIDLNHEYISEFLSAIDTDSSAEIKILTPEVKRDKLFYRCFEAVMTKNAREGYKALCEFLELYPEDREANDLYILQCLSMGYNLKAEKCTAKMIKVFPKDAAVFANYIYVKTQYEDYNPHDDLSKLPSLEVANFEKLKNVIGVLNYLEEYSLIVEITEKFAQEKNMQYSYDILMIKAIALQTAGKNEEAIAILKQINILYGPLGLSEFYLQWFCENKTAKAAIIDYNLLPVEMEIYLLNDLQKSVEEGQNYQNILKKSGLLLKYSLINANTKLFCLTINLCNDFCKKLRNDNFAEDIMAFINIHNEIPVAVKTQVIKLMIDSGKTEFCFFNSGSVDNVEFVPIAELEKFPKCYSDAYKLAFAFCCLNSISGANEMVMNSCIELMEVMNSTKKEFADTVALAGAILCNSYAIVGVDIVETVADLIGIKSNTIKNCIKTIKKYGSFFDLDQDEAAMEYIQNIMSKFGSIDGLE